MYLGLFMNTLGPIIVLVLVIVARGESLNLQGRMVLPEDGALRTLLYIAVAVSLVIIILTHMIKKQLFARSVCPEDDAKQQYFEQRVTAISRVVYSLNAVHTIIGLVLYAVGFPMEIMMLFTAGTLITYQFFRPRPKALEAFFEKIVGETIE